MLISKRNLTAIVTDNSGTRPTLENVLFEKDCSVSTDGSILIKVPYTDELPEDFPVIEGMTEITEETPAVEPFAIHQDSIDKILKNLPKKSHLPILSNALVDVEATNASEKHAIIATTDLTTPIIIRASKCQDVYPDYKQAIPSEDDVEYSIRLSVSVMERFLNAVKKGTKAIQPSFRLDFTGSKTAVRFRCEDMSGVVMPFRPNNDEVFPQDLDDETLLAKLKSEVLEVEARVNEARAEEMKLAEENDETPENES